MFYVLNPVPIVAHKFVSSEVNSNINDESMRILSEDVFIYLGNR